MTNESGEHYLADQTVFQIYDSRSSSSSREETAEFSYQYEADSPSSYTLAQPQLLLGTIKADFPAPVSSRLVQLHVEDCSEELLRQQSYALKNQLGHPLQGPY